uniref:PK domain-containing protein n=1 Tax=Haemonchus placei TaxID=6290 RepID=A0A0N4WXD0_HAEPC
LVRLDPTHPTHKGRATRAFKLDSGTNGTIEILILNGTAELCPKETLMVCGRKRLDCITPAEGEEDGAGGVKWAKSQ